MSLFLLHYYILTVGSETKEITAFQPSVERVGLRHGVGAKVVTWTRTHLTVLSHDGLPRGGVLGVVILQKVGQGDRIFEEKTATGSRSDHVSEIGQEGRAFEKPPHVLPRRSDPIFRHLYGRTKFERTRRRNVMAHPRRPGAESVTIRVPICFDKKKGSVLPLLDEKASEASDLFSRQSIVGLGISTNRTVDIVPEIMRAKASRPFQIFTR